MMTVGAASGGGEMSNQGAHRSQPDYNHFRQPPLPAARLPGPAQQLAVTPELKPHKPEHRFSYSSHPRYSKS